jgi:hypothetical protein
VEAPVAPEVAAPAPVEPTPVSAPALTVEINRSIDPSQLAAANAGLDSAKAEIAKARAKIAAAKKRVPKAAPRAAVTPEPAIAPQGDAEAVA